MSEPVLTTVRIEAEIKRAIEAGPAVFKPEELSDILSAVKAMDTIFEEKGGIFFHAGSNAFETADSFTKIHVNQYRESGRPSLPALAVYHADKMGLEKDSAEYRALVLVSVRAEMKAAVTPDYHNQHHFLDVAAMTANLLTVEAGGVALTAREKTLTLIAAIGHDLGHEGEGNPKGDPLYNETRSFDLMYPLLAEAGLSGPAIAKIHTILMTTSPNGPHALLKGIAKAYRDGRAPDFKTLDPENRFSDLHDMAQDKNLVQMAAMVSDADLYASGGAGLTANGRMSEFLTKEGKGAMDFTTDNARKFFLENIVGTEGFASDAGRKVANESFESMLAVTQSRVEAQRKKQSPAQP